MAFWTFSTAVVTPALIVAAESPAALSEDDLLGVLIANCQVECYAFREKFPMLFEFSPIE
jgi:hypothetical protein